VNGLLATLALIGWLLVLAGVGTILVEGYMPGTRLNVLGVNENAFGIQLLLAMPVFCGRQCDRVAPQGTEGTDGLCVPGTGDGLVALSGSRGSPSHGSSRRRGFCS